MAHRTIKTAYSKLADRLNRFPQGAPPSELLFKILKMLFSEKEAELVSLLPIKPFTTEKASRIWKIDLASTQNVLDRLAERALEELQRRHVVFFATVFKYLHRVRFQHSRTDRLFRFLPKLELPAFQVRMLHIIAVLLLSFSSLM